jgi:hypothetical protein
MAALYADEDFPFPVVKVLRTAGHDVLTVLEDGRASLGVGDSLVLARGTQLGRAVLTKNRRDYVRLHLANSAHAGVIVCTEDVDFDAPAARIHAAVSAVPLIAGQLIRVNRPNPSP